MVDYTKVTAVLAGLALVGALGTPFIANNNTDGLKDNIADLQAQLTATDGKIDNLDTSCELISPDNTKIDEIHTEIFEEDALEAEAEILARDEIEDDDYEEIAEYLSEFYGEDIDEDDIDRVIVKDKTITILDSNDKDVTVEFELKVYLEDGYYDLNTKHYITATVEIRDGEVENLTFTQTVRN